MITGNLEYLMGSLPYLTFQDTEQERTRVFSLFKKYADPLQTEKNSIAILEEEAGKFLSPRTHGVFQQIELKTIHGEAFRQNKNKVLSSFSNYMYSVKKSIEQLRIFRKNTEETSTTRKSPLHLQPGTPLEEELQLLKGQWDKLEELSIGHYTDFEALCIYKLKLLVLLRWWDFDSKRGFDNFLNSTKNTVHGR